MFTVSSCYFGEIDAQKNRHPVARQAPRMAVQECERSSSNNGNNTQATYSIGTPIACLVLGKLTAKKAIGTAGFSTAQAGLSDRPNGRCRLEGQLRNKWQTRADATTVGASDVAIDKTQRSYTVPRGIPQHRAVLLEGQGSRKADYVLNLEPQ